MPKIKKIRDKKLAARMARKIRVRLGLLPGTPERPRLSVFRSAKHIYVQAIDDTGATVLASACDLEETLQGDIAGKKKAERASLVGKAIAKKLLAKNIDSVVFDRNGFIYHGRVKNVADGAREGGLKF